MTGPGVAGGDPRAKDLIACRVALGDQLLANLQIALPGVIGLFQGRGYDQAMSEQISVCRDSS